MATISTEHEEKKRKPRVKKDLSFGEYVDRLSNDVDWEFLTDLYFCRCMPLTAVVDLYFLGRNIKEPRRKARDRMTFLYQAGILERAQTDPNEIRKNPKQRHNGIKKETWYFLSHKGFRLIETRLQDVDVERYRLSKNELDLERARKDHLWAVAQVYLDLKYKLMPSTAEQFHQWDWYPALTVYGHNDSIEIRPDAVLRILNQIYYIEMDRSSEPIRRSPFQKGDPIQVSITNKLERYKAVLHHSGVSEAQKNGIIAFIVPNAIYETRLKNILSVSGTVFTEKFPTKVLVGRTMQDIMAARGEASAVEEGEA
ncbi:replication-relaxation family protein [Paenibacillus sp. D51F]